jgi:hypothetical protein
MPIQQSKAFLGVGWQFPVQWEVTSGVSLAQYEEDVRQAILLILGTNHGERVMRPDFGANLNALVFEPFSTTTRSLAKHYVEEALNAWEPRIDNLKVDVEAQADVGQLMIHLEYRIRETNTFYNLVYPFYLMEGESDQ